MSTTKYEQTNKSEQNFLIHLLWNIGIPIVVIIIGLLLEYKSGIFQKIEQPNKNIEDYYLPLSLIFITMIATMMFTINSLSLWFRQRLYLREQLAFLLFFASLSATLLLVISLITGVMPWSIPLFFYRVVVSRTVFDVDTRWIDYAFLITLYIILVWALNQLHKNWQWLKERRAI